MQVNSNQLAQQLNKTLSPGFVLVGNEPLLIQESAQLIRDAAKKQGFSERVLFSVDTATSFNWEQFTAEFSCGSLFGDKKIIELILQTSKVPDVGQKTLADLQLQSDTLLLIRAEQLVPATLKTKWFNSLANNTTVVQHWPIDASRLSAWISTRARDLGLKLSPDVIKLISDRTEGNLLATQQELTKLEFLFGNKQVDLPQLEQAMALQSRYTVFDLHDELLKGNSEQSLKILNVLRQTGVEITLVLWAVCKILRTVYKARFKIQQGYAIPQALQDAGVWAKHVPLYTAACKRLDTAAVQAALQLADSIDSDFKTGKQQQAWRNLMSVCLSITGLAEMPATAHF